MYMSDIKLWYLKSNISYLFLFRAWLWEIMDYALTSPLMIYRERVAGMAQSVRRQGYVL